MHDRTATLDSIQTVRVGDDIQNLEKALSEQPVKLDIEHALVKDDPRQWSRARKFCVVVMICAAAMIAGLGGNIYNPAITQIEADLHATSSQLSLTVSLFILIQGGFPVLWSAVSEIQGRKIVYLVSISLCTLGCVVSAIAKTINVLIGMRCLQAAGASAVVSIGAATLADLFEPAERGTMMGIYLCAPLLGPSLGPIIGGILTQAFNWRATFWFLVIFTGLCAVSFIFFVDTFRHERSMSYQAALKKAMHTPDLAPHAKTDPAHGVDALNKLSETEHPVHESQDDTMSAVTTIAEIPEADTPKGVSMPAQEVKLTLKDVNPVRPMLQVLRRPNNVVIILASGTILYTASITLANAYHYDALKIGLVLLAFGMGCLLGSIFGGRYSDYVLTKVKASHGGKGSAEARTLRIALPTMFAMGFFPCVVIAYGWVTLAYIVDANVGLSSTAVATNSCIRGLFGFVATEIAVPLQNSIGDGGLYSMWAGLMVVSELLILLVWWKGGQWREKSA
ncbi:hypothetical protein POSPLADRAFT_1160028 [Postia placenta MAD-698-R-SB12]|uniref:Major facilitator superfamily (MFS) profile domain-containing protein n=1 Tax=Postia placenta MAD-698-R-SB12 TaxID=670580 RepID=A0A1X6MK64_9APHY|nr:hypothetical protein POSPLADRAFT_1160028 [Postia placenta MAD-698-R-SB12]OSX56433.1 hypothetical protein POSPLADRAFT_1160028 [Postia placenta MAD-698-R-SB12]